MNLRFPLCAGLALGLAAMPLWAGPDTTQPHVSVEMIGADSTLQPGRPVTVGFHFHIDRGWHLYWQNPGDSGLAPEFIWNLPPGFTAGPVLWPTPQRLALPSLVDYGYRNDVLFMVPIQVPADAHPGAVVDLSAMVRWLVCDEICIPGRVQLELKRVVKTRKPGPSKNSKYFSLAARALPQPWPTGWKARGTLDAKAFHLVLATPGRPTGAVFFPLHPNQIENTAPQEFRYSSHVVHLDLKRSDQLTDGVQTLEGLVVLKSKSGSQAYRIAVPLAGSH